MQPIGDISSALIPPYLGGSAAAPEGVNRSADVVEIGARARSDAWGAALGALQGLLGRLQVTPGSAGETKSALQSILAPIREIAGGGAVKNPEIRFTAHDVDGAIESISIVDAKISPGGERDLEVTVTQSARRGELMLDFRADALDTQLQKDDADARFEFILAGAKGLAEFSFASGTTIEDVAKSINERSEELGVQAEAIKGGILRLTSAKHGDDEFVSVEIIEDGGFAGHLYNPGEASVEFDEARRPMTDFGQSLRAVVDGIEFVGDGLFLRTIGANIDAVLLLHESRAQTLGKFKAADVRAWGPLKPLTPPDQSPGTRPAGSTPSGGPTAPPSAAASLGAALDVLA